MITVELVPSWWTVRRSLSSGPQVLPWYVRRDLYGVGVTATQFNVNKRESLIRYKTEAGAQKAADKLNERTRQ